MRVRIAKSVVLWLALCVRCGFAHAQQNTSTSVAPTTQKASESAEEYQALDIINRSQLGILRMRGFNGQVHYAVSRDGYYIHLVRIINPLIKERSRLKRPVVFNHGLIESSTLWLVNSRDSKPTGREGLCATLPLNLDAVKNGTEFINGPMLLANHHYDVWLMSMRGTDYSQYHDQMDPSMPEFWDYSLDNFALDDVPTVINYIRRVTGAPKVGYVGHSQASFSVFGLLAARPHYADLIEPVIAVAPVAYLYHTTSIARPLFIQALDKPDVHGPVPESAKRVRASMTRICAKNNRLATKFACGLINSLIGGSGKSPRKGYYSHLPFSTSRKVLRHFGQLVTSKRFSMYDHGPEENLRRYGQKEAPLYKAGAIRSKALVLIWTKTDTLSHPEDVAQFKGELTVPVYREVFIDREFNHFDMVTHDDARFLVNAPMLEVLEQFERRNGMCSRNGPAGEPPVEDELPFGGALDSLAGSAWARAKEPPQPQDAPELADDDQN